MLSHIDSENRPRMVNVTEKAVTHRVAKALCKVLLPPEVASCIENKDIVTKKGAVFATAIIAGTMAVKRTHELIPFCHPLSIEGCKIDIIVENSTEVCITCTVEIESW